MIIVGVCLVVAGIFLSHGSKEAARYWKEH